MEAKGEGGGEDEDEGGRTDLVAEISNRLLKQERWRQGVRVRVRVVGGW